MLPRSSDDGDGAAVGSPVPQQAEPAGSPPPDQPVTVSGTFWHSGFEVDVTGGMLTTSEEELSDERQRMLELDATFTNLGDRQVGFGAEVVVVSGTESFPTSRESDLPAVPGGLTGDGQFVFEVDDAFDPAPAHLRIGGGDEHKAQMPLGPDGGELVDLAPQEPDISGTASVELLDLEITSAELRADQPHSYGQVTEGELELTLHVTATSRRGGNWTLGVTNLALIRPDGNAVGMSSSELPRLNGNDSGIETDRLVLRFPVPEPSAGEYPLRYTVPSWFQDGDGPSEATTTFTL